MRERKEQMLSYNYITQTQPMSNEMANYLHVDRGGKNCQLADC